MRSKTAASGANLGAARADSGAAVSLQLEGAVGHGRNHLVELLLPALSHHHPRPSGGGLPRPPVASSAGEAVGGVGRTAGASGALGNRIYRAQRGRLALEWLPGYAPELNPVEYIW